MPGVMRKTQKISEEQGGYWPRNSISKIPKRKMHRGHMYSPLANDSATEKDSEKKLF